MESKSEKRKTGGGEGTKEGVGEKLKVTGKGMLGRSGIEGERSVKSVRDREEIRIEKDRRTDVRKVSVKMAMREKEGDREKD